nr:NADH dehydrogenase subunit 5 [Jacobiasca formosana]UER93874.1 NADH dehydrogenase subunit 5 [Jacobiasca formosana]
MLKLNYYLNWGFILFMISIMFFMLSLLFSMESKTLMFEWIFIQMNSFNLIYLIILDSISLSFMGVVCMISSMVILYSSEYMGVMNYNSNRFLFLVLLFIMSMMLMIISPNLISILLGWDGLGLISYCLVIFYNSMKSYLAGMLTCLVNRLGDIGLIISLAWTFSYGSWNFMFYTEYFNKNIFILIVILSFTKSAQIPFSMWLPAAMAAPTPVSALVHSSTLVTAGVYLLIRFFNYFNFNNYLFMLISMLTLMMASFSAIFEFDLKKIIALSTLSQLGLMMSTLFFGFKNLTFFHLCTHAMFKSLLFLCAGIYIFYMNDNQDIRYMGSVSNMMPYTSCCFVISNITLCGMPFLSGFYSKDLIVEMNSMNNVNLFIYLMFYFSLSLTVWYTVRLVYYSMFCNYKNTSLVIFTDKLSIMKYSIFLLTIKSILFGCWMLWIMNLNTSFIILPFYIKIMTLCMLIMGYILSSEMLVMKKYLMSNYFYNFTNMWLMYNFSLYLYKMNYLFSYKYINLLNWGEYYGTVGLYMNVIKYSNSMQYYLINNFMIMLLTFFLWSYFMM